MRSRTGRPVISEAELFQRMSEVLSLREKVAQAELEAHVYATEDFVLHNAKTNPRSKLED